VDSAPHQEGKTRTGTAAASSHRYRFGCFQLAAGVRGRQIATRGRDRSDTCGPAHSGSPIPSGKPVIPMYDSALDIPRVCVVRSYFNHNPLSALRLLDKRRTGGGRKWLSRGDVSSAPPPGLPRAPPAPGPSKSEREARRPPRDPTIGP